MSVTINDKMLTKVYRLVEEEEGQECWHWEEGEVYHAEEEEGEQHFELLWLLLDLFLDLLLDFLLGFYLVTGLRERGQVDVFVTYPAHALVWLV